MKCVYLSRIAQYTKTIAPIIITNEIIPGIFTSPSHNLRSPAPPARAYDPVSSLNSAPDMKMMSSISFVIIFTYGLIHLTYIELNVDAHNNL